MTDDGVSVLNKLLLLILVHLLCSEVLLEDSLCILVHLMKLTQLQVLHNTLSTESVENVACIHTLLKEVVN